MFIKPVKVRLDVDGVVSASRLGLGAGGDAGGVQLPDL